MATASTPDAYRAKIRIGLLVIVGLAVLTGIEFVVAGAAANAVLWLTPFAVAKGWLILQFFMHAGDLRGGTTAGGEH